jgi:Protein of unknown function (DUF418)
MLAWAAPLGRMAFTNYLAQSVIFGWIFYGYGLGLFDRAGVTTAIAIGICVYVAQVMIRALWLRHFRFGPVEWVWRSLMYGSPQPLRQHRAAWRQDSVATLIPAPPLLRLPGSGIVHRDAMRLEGWTRGPDSRPSFKTHASAAQICSQARRMAARGRAPLDEIASSAHPCSGSHIRVAGSTRRRNDLSRSRY